MTTSTVSRLSRPRSAENDDVGDTCRSWTGTWVSGWKEDAEKKEDNGWMGVIFGADG